MASDDKPSQALQNARTVARWLDRRYIDPILGLVIPEVGDLVTTSFGLYVVWVAWRERVPLPVIARMMLNLGIDALVGIVPILGDLFDFVFRAHSRNLALLEARLPTRKTTVGDVAILVGAFAFIVGGVLGAIFIGVKITTWLFGLVTGS